MKYKTFITFILWGIAIKKKYQENKTFTNLVETVFLIQSKYYAHSWHIIIHMTILNKK